MYLANNLVEAQLRIMLHVTKQVTNNQKILYFDATLSQIYTVLLYTKML